MEGMMLISVHLCIVYQALLDWRDSSVSGQYFSLQFVYFWWITETFLCCAGLHFISLCDGLFHLGSWLTWGEVRTFLVLRYSKDLCGDPGAWGQQGALGGGSSKSSSIHRCTLGKGLSLSSNPKRSSRPLSWWMTWTLIPLCTLCSNNYISSIHKYSMRLTQCPFYIKTRSHISSWFKHFETVLWLRAIQIKWNCWITFI